jgi:hypothetical protein
MIEQGNSPLKLESHEISTSPIHKNYSEPIQTNFTRENLMLDSYPSRSLKTQQPNQAPPRTDFRSPSYRLKYLRKGIPCDRWGLGEDSPSLQDLEKSLSPRNKRSKDSFNSVFPVRITGLSTVGRTIAASRLVSHENNIEELPNKEHFRKMDEMIAYNISMIKASGLTRQLRK